MRIAWPWSSDLSLASVSKVPTLWGSSCKFNDGSQFDKLSKEPGMQKHPQGRRGHYGGYNYSSEWQESIVLKHFCGRRDDVMVQGTG